MKLKATRPYDGSVMEYDPETEGHYITRFKPGITQQDLYIAPFPSRTFAQLAYGWVGNPRNTMEAAQRDLCWFVARYPSLAHVIEICKCPFAMAESSAFVVLTDIPDPRVLKIAEGVEDFASTYQRDRYFAGTGEFA